jgi:FkbM family methyltransferase
VEQVVQLLKAGKFRPFSFVQIGGFDGRTGDPIYDIVTSFRIPGVIVEPQPVPFQRLTETYANRRDITLINAAVDWEAGERVMYVIEPGHNEYPWVYQLASFRKEVVLHHCQTLPAIADWIQEVQLPCLTFKDVLDTVGFDEIGLLQVDTEGYDAEIIKMMVYTMYPKLPQVVHFEHFHLTNDDRADTKAMLSSMGYTLQQGHMDILAIRETSS